MLAGNGLKICVGASSQISTTLDDNFDAFWNQFEAVWGEYHFSPSDSRYYLPNFMSWEQEENEKPETLKPRKKVFFVNLILCFVIIIIILTSFLFHKMLWSIIFELIRPVTRKYIFLPYFG